MTKMLVQKAAKSGNDFHINEALNGIARPSNLHLTGHNHYNDVVGSILTGFNPNATVDEAYDFVLGFAATLELTFSEIWAQTRIVKFQ